METEHDYTSHNTHRLSVEQVAELLANRRRCVRRWRRCRGDADRAHRTLTGSSRGMCGVARGRGGVTI